MVTEDLSDSSHRVDELGSNITVLVIMWVQKIPEFLDCIRVTRCIFSQSRLIREPKIQEVVIAPWNQNYWCEVTCSFYPDLWNTDGLVTPCQLKEMSAVGRDVYWPRIVQHVWFNISTFLSLCSCWCFVPSEKLWFVGSSWMCVGKTWPWSCPVSGLLKAGLALAWCATHTHCTRHTMGDAVSAKRMKWLLFENCISTNLEYVSNFYHRSL